MDVAFRWIQLRPRPGLQAAGSDEPASRAPHRGERKIVFREATRGMDAKEPLERSATNNCESPTLVAASFWWTPQQPRRHRHRVRVPRGVVDAADARLARCKRRLPRHRVASADAGVPAAAPVAGVGDRRLCGLRGDALHPADGLPVVATARGRSRARRAVDSIRTRGARGGVAGALAGAGAGDGAGARGAARAGQRGPGRAERPHRWRQWRRRDSHGVGRGSAPRRVGNAPRRPWRGLRGRLQQRRADHRGAPGGTRSGGGVAACVRRPRRRQRAVRTTDASDTGTDDSARRSHRCHHRRRRGPYRS
mmetsp:Transcript_17190/g.53371  ORF Transcript_17190/g.53371 Transcript_17190/m.53371 type:complete len:308 (+) Transcript_17190:180-1103(+)